MKLLHTLALALLTTAAPLLAQEADAPATVAPAKAEFSALDLHPLFAKAAKNLERPWECDLSLAVTSPNGPATGTGHVRYFYHGLFSASFGIETGRDGGKDRADLQVLADGEYIYFSIDQGGGQAFAAKVALSVFEGGPADLLGAVSGMEGGGAPADLVQKLAAIQFEQAEVDGGKLSRLKADLTSLIPEGEGGPEKLELSLDFDAKNAFPKGVQILAGDEGSLELGIAGLSFPEDMDREQFEYKGPMAFDLTAQIQLALRQSGAEVEEEIR
ncbi:MAG: hypothetical protein ISR76_08795 [Planctomycetes bacterium]|nr:hypothetical protein [Planctomycetota bacterium]MBL7009081.1 hypothetical protein [Planctomycetota bacterium]